MIPYEQILKKLEEWTYDRIKMLVDSNVNESDFNADIPNGEGLTKDCCAFANSKGGFIGIRTKDKRTEIVRNESSSELRNLFGQKIIATPNIDFGLPNVQNIPNSEK